MSKPTKSEPWPIMVTAKERESLVILLDRVAADLRSYEHSCRVLAKDDCEFGRLWFDGCDITDEIVRDKAAMKLWRRQLRSGR